MASFSATSEIVEASEETYPGQPSMESYRMRYGSAVKEGKLPMVGYNNFLEEDLNHLFEAINLKDFSKSEGGLSQPRTSPMRKSALKRPIALPRSPGIGISEQVNLKQALRELCLSKASEMAATKRLSKSRPSGASEAGRIKTLYNSVVIEASRSSTSLDKEGKGSMVEISLVPEDSLSKPVKNDNLKIHTVKSPTRSPRLSPRSVVMTSQSSNEITEEESDIVHRPKKLGAQTLKEELARKEKDASPPSASSSNTIRNVLVQDEATPASSKLANKASSSKPGRKGRLQTVASSVSGNRVSRFSRNTARTVKPVIRNKALAKKKVKQESTIDICSSSTQNVATETVNPSAKPLICERCQCAIKSAGNESKEIYSESKFNSVGAEVSLMNNGKSGSGKDAVLKGKRNMKMQEKGEFSQSSKSSHGEYSSSTTSISEESNASRSSCGNRPHMSKDVRWEAIRQVRRQSGTLRLTHFNLLKKLGCGDIGTVYLAELVGTNCVFAIKVMDNEFLARRKKMPRAQTEREILRMLDHPFLPTLYSQFTSDNLSCLVMEYCPGGDLHVLRQKQLGRVFSEPAARFYVAEVLLALEYLHMLGVVYRDLKPENILVREDGHIMLTDFDLSLRCTVNPTLLKSSSFNLDPVRISGPCTGSTCAEPFCIEPACQVPCFSPRFLPNATKARKLKSDLSIPTRSLPQLVAEPTEARSNSFVGTHEYLAPEIIKGEGHGAAVDWWTFGVFLYELLYGKTPFKGPSNDETLANVVLQGLKFPDSPLVSFQARDLIRGLLVKEPENRFGSEKGAAEIKQHPFFEGLNWALIRCAVPPDLPDQFCDFDVTNFAAAQQNYSKYLDYKANGEHVEFELF